MGEVAKANPARVGPTRLLQFWGMLFRLGKTRLEFPDEGHHDAVCRSFWGEAPSTTPRRFTISTNTISYADSWQDEDVHVIDARRRGIEIGVTSPSTSAAASIRLLAATVDAQAVVEVGTGAGVSGLLLLSAMRPDGILTTIDADAGHQAAAKDAFSSSDIPSGRARLITGEPLDVLPRLADASYDMVVINTPSNDFTSYFEQALRLLRVGGVVVFTAALGLDGGVADPAQRDPGTVALRTLGQRIKDHEGLVAALLPVGDGLLAAVKREA